jgi:hypothetical protein
VRGEEPHRASRQDWFAQAVRQETAQVFLEWFAATCNVKLSAEKAGICYQTVFRHRMKDEAFAEAWDQALQQGYARLEARLLQEVHAPGFGPSGTLPEGGPSTAFGGPPPHPAKPGREEYEIAGDLDDAEVEERFDPQLAMLLLREHARRLPGSADKGKAGAMPRVASNREIAAALTKRLKAFALRVGQEAAHPSKTGPHPAHPRIESGGESPSPSRREGEE